jgi:hypothetical protein
MLDNEIKIDDIVLVSTTDSSEQYIRRFAGNDRNGKFLTYRDGYSSKNRNWIDFIHWDYCEKVK